MRGGLTRRRLLYLLAMAAASAGGGIVPVWAAVPIEETKQKLGEVLQSFLGKIDDPWALMHAVLALGVGIRRGNQKVIDFVFERYAKFASIGGRQYAHFDVEKEAHPNLVLKNLLDHRLSFDHVFTVQGKRVAFQRVFEDAKALYWFDPARMQNAIEWTLPALSERIKPGQDAWVNAYGERVVLGDAVAWVFSEMERAMAPMVDAIKAPRGGYQRGPIHDWAEGGVHLLYALIASVKNGYTSNDYPRRLKAQIDLLVLRLQKEQRLMEQAMGAVLHRYSPQQVDLYLGAEKVKFLGHALEDLHYARRHKVWAPTPEQRKAVAKAEQDLVDAARRLFQHADMEKLRVKDFEFFKRIYGDCGHAYRGIALRP